MDRFSQLIKDLVVCIIVAHLLLVVSCAILQSHTEQSQLQIYTFNYNGKDYSVLLPEQIAMPPENAQLDLQCFPAPVSICAMHVWYIEGKKPIPALPVASFWFTKKLGVVGLVWHTLNLDGSIKHEPFLYIKGLPVPTNYQGFEALLNKLLKPKASGEKI